MSEPKRPRVYYAYHSGISGFCYLTWYSEANDCDVPAPEGDYIRESDYADLEAENTQLRTELARRTDQRDQAKSDYMHERMSSDQLRTERDSWKGMYILCNEREQKLSKIKEDTK